MLVVYNRASLVILHCVYASGPDYKAFVDADPERGWLETKANKRPDELAVTAIGGVPALVERTAFPFTVPSSANVGAAIRITGIPNKTEISSESGSLTMGTSGILDLSFDVAGSYSLTFTHPLYLTYTATIEVAA